MPSLNATHQIWPIKQNSLEEAEIFKSKRWTTNDKHRRKYPVSKRPPKQTDEYY